MNVETRVASAQKASTIISNITRMYSRCESGIPGPGRTSCRLRACERSAWRSANASFRSMLRIDSRYSSSFRLSAKLPRRFSDRASSRTRSRTDRSEVEAGPRRNMRSKITRGSMSRGAGVFGEVHESVLRTRLLLKKPSPLSDNSSDGSSVFCPMVLAANWSAETPPASLRRP